MVHLKLDGISIEAERGTTLLEAARRAGVEIPTLCHHPGIEPPVSCFLCVVALEGRERLVPACATRVEEGMSVHTGSPEVLEARRMALELLLSDHAGECSAPCRLACPAGLDISFLLWLLVRGRRQEAGRLAHSTLLLPGSLGAVCAGYCQSACRRAEVDRAIAIAAVHRRLGEEPRAPMLLAAAEGPPVAVVGAGPAGLAAAATLRRSGRAVILFEANDSAGGGLAHSVEARTLPGPLLARECAVLLQGLEFRPGFRLGQDQSLEDLLRAHPAVLVATGDPAQLDGYAVDRRTGAAQRPGLFAAGQSLAAMGRAAVRAVASGRRVAEGLLRFLEDGSFAGAPPRPVQVRYRDLVEEERAWLLRLPGSISVEPTSDQEAREAARCLQCGCLKEESCRLRLLATTHGARPGRHAGERRSLSRDQSHPRVLLESGKCILCGICVGLTGGEGMAFHGRGFSTRAVPPFDGPLAQCLGARALEAAAACPTGALALKDGLEADRTPGLRDRGPEEAGKDL